MGHLKFSLLYFVHITPIYIYIMIIYICIGNKTKKRIYEMSAEEAKVVCIIYACVRLPAWAKDITHFMLDKRSSLHELRHCSARQRSIDSYFFHSCFRKNSMEYNVEPTGGFISYFLWIYNSFQKCPRCGSIFRAFDASNQQFSEMWQFRGPNLFKSIQGSQVPSCQRMLLIQTLFCNSHVLVEFNA